eukprot:Gb_07722 [translate_table: standard]
MLNNMHILGAHQTVRAPFIHNSLGVETVFCRCPSRNKAFCARQPNRIWVLGCRRFPHSYGLSMGISAKKQADAGPTDNMNEDLDEELDKLLDEYGEVVFTNPNQKPPRAEANDDAECLSFAVALAKAANDVKAADIQVLFVKPLVYWTRFFIIATAFSRPQIDAIGLKIRDIAESEFKKIPTGDVKPNSWTLLDFGDVIVHIFLPQQRAFYNLEEFYGNATLVELPFKTQVTRQE